MMRAGSWARKEWACGEGGAGGGLGSGGVPVGGNWGWLSADGRGGWGVNVKERGG